MKNAVIWILGVSLSLGFVAFLVLATALRDVRAAAKERFLGLAKLFSKALGRKAKESYVVKSVDFGASCKVRITLASGVLVKLKDSHRYIESGPPESRPANSLIQVDIYRKLTPERSLAQYRFEHVLLFPPELLKKLEKHGIQELSLYCDDACAKCAAQ